MVSRQPPYTAASLHRHNLQKLTRRDVRGARRINPSGRSHPNVHYVAVKTDAITDRGKTYSAIDRNASVLARLAAMPAAVRVRFIYGIKDEKGNILDSYSTTGIRIKEYTWDEMRMFFDEDTQVAKNQRKSPLKAREERYEDEPEDEDDRPDPDVFPLLYIAWETV